MYVCMYVFVCMCVCMYVCACMYVCVCMCVCMFVRFLRKFIYVHSKHACISMSVRKHLRHTYTHTCIHADSTFT